MTGYWDLYVVCPCGWHGMNGSWRVVCPDCGSNRSEWHKEVCRWIDTGKLFKPWTWADGYWESKGTVTE